MDLEEAREDLLVAVTAAGTTVALALVDRFVVDGAVGVFAMLAPLFVYFGYVFTRKARRAAGIDNARSWALLAVLVGAVAFGYSVAL